MKKLLILFIGVCLTGCVKNDDFSKTCKISTKTQNITDEVVNYITYDADDNVKKVVAVRTITALNYSGETTLKDIKESAILNLQTLPKSVLIVGSGAIGLEWARIFSNFDVQVTVVEMAEHLLPLADIEVSKRVERIFKQKKIKYYLNVLKLKDSTLDEFKLKKNSIKLFKKMRDENINCE